MWVLPNALMLSAVAQARDPTCPDLYVEQFERYLEELDGHYLNLRFDVARALLEAGEPLVPCIVQVVPTEDLAAFAVRRAWAHALDVDQIEAERWARLARSLDPRIAWPDYVPVDHSAYGLLDEVGGGVVHAAGEGLVVPEGGGVFLDGRFLTEPRAELEAPHLLQVGDEYGRLVITKWQDGAAFPSELLGPPPLEAPEPPRWFTHPSNRPGPPKVPEPWSQARKNRLESALGFAVASGALFGSAWATRQAYDARPTDGLFYTVNGMTLASGAAGGTSVVLLGAALFGR